MVAAKAMRPSARPGQSQIPGARHLSGLIAQCPANRGRNSMPLSWTSFQYRKTTVHTVTAWYDKDRHVVRLAGRASSRSAIRVTPAIFQPDNYVFSRKLMVKFGLPEMVNTLG